MHVGAAVMTKPIPSTAPPNLVSVIVMRPDDTAGAACVPIWAATRKRKARYRCGRCLKGLVIAKMGYRCKMQGCHAEVVDVIKRGVTTLYPRRSDSTP